MIVASFYSPRKHEESKRYQRFGVNYDELLMLVEASCRRYNLDHFVISDSPRPAPLKTFLTWLPENLMQSFITGQLQFLREAGDERVLFIGADCLFCKDPSKLLPGLFDLTVTMGDFVDCPLNMGGVWVNYPPSCLRVWERALQLSPQAWGEDQKVFYQAVNEIRSKGVLGVEEIPCDVHNKAPDSLEDDAGLPTIAHFRGSRKIFMFDWAKKHIDLMPVERG